MQWEIKVDEWFCNEVRIKLEMELSLMFVLNLTAFVFFFFHATTFPQPKIIPIIRELIDSSCSKSRKELRGCDSILCLSTIIDCYIIALMFIVVTAIGIAATTFKV